MKWVRIVSRTLALSFVCTLTYLVAALGAVVAGLWGRVAGRPWAEGHWRALIFRLSPDGKPRAQGDKARSRMTQFPK